MRRASKGSVPRAPARWRVREGRPADLEAVVALASKLWPDEPASGHRRYQRALLAGAPPGTLPAAVLVTEAAGSVIGFVEVGLRSHADGCDPERPVGFIEGWFVERAQRGRGAGRALVRAAERWAAAQGCVEMASDTWADNPGSQRAHAALGYQVVDRCVHFRKRLRAARRRRAR